VDFDNAPWDQNWMGEKTCFAKLYYISCGFLPLFCFQTMFWN